VKVIFACVHNAGRSQMAAAFFNQYADASKAIAVSAGTQPAEKIHECVLRTMQNFGIDLSVVKPQLLTDDLTRSADVLITMGCGEACPLAPDIKREDWPLSDPKDRTEEEVSIIRDEIKMRVLKLLQEIGALGCSASPGKITEDDDNFLQSFEECSLGAKCWNHTAHLRMGWLVLEKSTSFEEALERIRNGIMRFNSSKNSIGYHETITVAFARLIDSRRKVNDDWTIFADRNSDLFEKNCLEKFYSPEVLSSEKARKIFIEPDRCALPRSVSMVRQ